MPEIGIIYFRNNFFCIHIILKCKNRNLYLVFVSYAFKFSEIALKL